ncbi:MAG: hypothetical protein NC430_09370 [bacterium]|nr:hypothetical protein [bacterium]
MLFIKLFIEENEFISQKEIDCIGNIEIIKELINYSKISNCLDECISIHKKIIEDSNKKNDYARFYLGLIESFGIENCYDLICEYCIGIKEIPDYFIEVLVKEVNSNELSAKAYVDLLENVEKISDKAAETLVTIGWIGGLSIKLCNRLAEIEKWIYYICNMAIERVKEIKLIDGNIIKSINNNATWLYQNANVVWSKLRIEVLSHDELISEYMMLFSGEFPIIAKQEIMLITNIENAIKILKASVVTEDEVEYIAQYFNQKSRNQTESYNIFQYLLSLEAGIAERLFYALDINGKVQYRRMSKVRRKEISAKLIELFDVKNADEKIKLMNHIGMSISGLEKDLYIALNSDDKVLAEYLNFINSLDKVDSFTIQNIIKLNSIQIYSSVINNKLYEMKEYVNYVSSKTRGLGKFEMETDKKSVLWETYKKMFNGTGYSGTRKYMIENKEFLKELIDDYAYKNSGEQIIAYVHVFQSVNLLQYIFDTLPHKEAEEYFACIEGFDSFESADYFVKRIINERELLNSDKVYDNAHDKLIDSGLKAKYTKARNKLRSKE